MTDIEKIRTEIERLKKENETYVDKDYAESQKWNMHGAYHVLFELSNFIDSLQEEHVSVWHDIKELPMARECEYILVIYKDTTSPHVAGNKTQVSHWDRVDKWAYLNDLLNLSYVQRTVKALQEEPVSDDLEEACEQLAENARKYKAETSSPFFSQTDYIQGVIDGAKWKEKRLLPMIDNICRICQKQQDFINAKDLGEQISTLSRRYPEVSFAKLSRIAVRVAKWQKQHLWKPADGDDLPEIDREVVVLTQPYPLENSEYAVSFAHRPNPNGWDGKSLATGKIEHYTPKTYDKGGWNIPDVKWWLDVELPKEIEL